MNDKYIVDDSNLAQCDKCGFVDYWDEIPKGYCSFAEESLYQCPQCAGVDWFSDYDPAKAVIRELANKAEKAHGSGH
jgi:hypothetical protein